MFRSHYSSMNSLSSMSTSCLQNREASSYYPMFHHEALSSLSSYGRSCGVSSQSSAINSHMPSSYGSSLSSPSSGSGSAASGMPHPKKERICVTILWISGLLGSGMSQLPLQVPAQTADIASNYWPLRQ